MAFFESTRLFSLTFCCYKCSLRVTIISKRSILVSQDHTVRTHLLKTQVAHSHVREPWKTPPEAAGLSLALIFVCHHDS